MHASPRAEVAWLKDGRPIDSGSAHISHRGNRHTLLLKSVSEAAFGQYTCSAKNAFGSDSATTEVSGQAGPVSFKSDPKGDSYNSYTLEWMGQSSTPITHFKVQFRSHSRNNNKNMPVFWTTREIAAVNVDRDFYSGDFTMENLSGSTVYETRVASKNSYGYSKFSEPFKFATKGADPVQKPITGNASNTISASMVSIVLAVAFSRILLGN